MSFDKLMRPESVAVVGASKDPSKVGHYVLKNIVTDAFKGAVYPVNPTAAEILGRKAYPSLTAIPGPVDLAVIVVKRDAVAGVLEECKTKNVKAVIVITAGFSETGSDGKQLQQRLAQLARESRITMLGPNCLGLINPWHSLNASFGQKTGKPGHIALISQSGALLTAIQDLSAGTGLDFSLLASIGNKAVLDEVDFLGYLKNDEKTRVIAAYLEDISRGQDFMKVAERVSKTKPIVVLKSGRTSSGAKAASSHTGSLAGADAAYNCAFERSGIIRADSIEHLFDISTALAYQPFPRGDRIAIVTNAGGPGIMMTDAVEMTGLKVAAFDAQTSEKLKAVMPAAGSLKNPVDVLGDAGPELYAKTLEILLAADCVDAVIVILTPQKMTDAATTADRVASISLRFGKPVFACFMGGEAVEAGIRILRENRIPQYPVPERAARAMREMVLYSRYKAKPLRIVERFAFNKNPVIKMFKAYRSRSIHEIGEIDSKAIMKAYNFNMPPGFLATSLDEAVNFADQLGYPLAMKISSPDILHKSDVGGVRIGLRSESEVADAYELMMLRVKRKKPDAEVRGVLIEKMVTGYREVILGMKKDPQFGPMIMFGLGGIFVEVLKDVTFGLAPVTDIEARAMIERTRSYKLLTGARGQAPVDIGAIVENIQRLSQLVMDHPDIAEVDINPLMVGDEGDGALVVDARIIISEATHRL